MDREFVPGPDPLAHPGEGFSVEEEPACVEEAT